MPDLEGLEIRTITRDEFPALARHVSRALGFDQPSADWLEVVGSDFDPSRSAGAFDGEQLVGSTYSHLFELTLPGLEVIPAAGVTAVAVAPTHRRRGILRTVTERQLAECRERGEPVAILIASESVIYGRFGYGLASSLYDVEIDPRQARLAHPIDAPGRLRTIDDDTADKVFPEVYDRFRRSQPGAINRQPSWWELWRRDRKPHAATHIVYENADGTVDGYASYTKKGRWEAGLPEHTLHVADLTTVTTEALAALWGHVLGVDLVTKVTVHARPVDEPLRWLLADPRRMKVTRLGDFLWARPLDVERLLSSRRYRIAGEIVLDVDDPMFPDVGGRFAVDGSPEGATCDRIDGEAHLAMGIGELGAISLGGTTAAELARVGRIRELTSGAVARADAMFASDPKPWGNTWF